MPPKGMEMMLKAMGIDANALLGGYQEAAKKFQEVCNHFDASLKRIEARLDRIEKHLDVETAEIKNMPVQERNGTNG